MFLIYYKHAYKHNYTQSIRPSQTAAFPIFAANRKEVLNLSSQKDIVPN